MKTTTVARMYPVLSNVGASSTTLVNTVGGIPTINSFRDVNCPIFVEPAVKLMLSPAALKILTNPIK